MPFETGARLGPYEVLESLTDSAGEAYRASDTRMSRTVRIHVLPTGLSENLELRERLERESQTIASLRHPHISGVLDSGTHDGTRYLVTEYLEGETLAQQLKRGSLEISQALQ